MWAGNGKIMECTSSVIHRLEQLLSCRVCENLLKDPSNISACDHVFCRSCILSVLRNTGRSCCPVCSLPSWIKDIQPNHELTSLVNANNLQMSDQKLSSCDSPETLSHRWAGHKRKFSYDGLIITNTYDGTRTVCETASAANYQKGFSPDISRVFFKVDSSAKRQKIKQYSGEKTKTGGTVVPGKPSVVIGNMKRNVRGETPLHVASIKGDTALVQSLLDQGADPNAQDNAGWTPLHEACNHGNLTTVQVLLNNGAIVNVPGYHNNTPLHDAVENNHVSIVKCLREHGADCSIRNHYGFTAGELAVSDAMHSALSTPVSGKSSVQKVYPAGRRTTVILSSGLKPYQKSLLYKTISSLGGSLTERLSKEVTHVVTCSDENKCCSRTVKCLSAVAAGKWLVDYQWIVSCNASSTWINEKEFEIKGFIVNKRNCVTDGPEKGRISKLEKEPGLFDGFEMYFCGVYNSPLPSKDDLTSLVSLAQGKVLAREPRMNRAISSQATYPFHASPNSKFSSHHVIVIHPSCQPHIQGTVVHISASWILDCLTCFKLVDFST